jgi:hypothetical protein
MEKVVDKAIKVIRTEIQMQQATKAPVLAMEQVMAMDWVMVM